MSCENQVQPTTKTPHPGPANKKGGKRAVIHTTAMMEPDAAQDLSDLATANGGEFTIIGADGKTTKGAEFFKQQAAMPK